MNYQFFDLLYRKFQCDELKMIGKEIEHDGKWYHIIGLTLKEKKRRCMYLNLMRMR